MSKGQIFSLDFLISIIAMVLAVGLLIQSMELQTYRMREQQSYTELKMVAETAADLLVSNPDIVCELVDGSDSPLGNLNNCLPQGNISKSDLGIPSSYNCEIDDSGAGIGSDCTGNPTDAANLYSVSRSIVVPSTATVSKADLYSCMDGGSCTLTQKTITLKVWKP